MIAATTCFITCRFAPNRLRLSKTPNIHLRLMQRPSARERPKALFNRTVLSLELDHKGHEGTRRR
jgi:hypothetical protein